MSDIKININTQGGTIITGGEFHDIEFVANKFVYHTESKRHTHFEDIEDAVEVTDEAQVNRMEDSSTHEIPDSVKECFRFTSEFVKQHVESIIKDFYLNKPVNLAIIERTLFDHNILCKSNSHKSFICALMDWGILSEETDIRKTANGMATKFKSFPLEGYKEWSNDHLNDRTFCNNIGKKLPETMKYNRDK